MAIKKDEIRDMQKNDLRVNKALEELANICKVAYKDGVEHRNIEFLKKELLDGETPPETPPETQEHRPAHTECDSTIGEPDPEKENEKRICRCMRYYDGDSDKCKKECPLKRKWKEDKETIIKVEEYEWPMKYVLPGVGGIDLLCKYGQKTYAVETKRPEGNRDTISLMFAEIMTYTYDSDDYLPAIAVFENGFHHRKINKLIKEKNRDFKTITDYIPVFLIKYEENGEVANYKIVPMVIDY